MKVLILVFCLAACAFAAPSNIHGSRIVGGHDAKKNQFPHQASLQWAPLGLFYQHVCGASIINDHWVVTAGHCITELPMAGQMQVKLGLLNLNDNGADVQTIKVVERIVHRDYHGGVNAHDVALLRLDHPMKFTDSVQPIGLPELGEEVSGDSVLSGWGSTSNTLWPSMPTHLQTVDTNIVPYAECAEALAKSNGGVSDPLDKKANICTGPLTGGVSACSGDSGGPLIQDGKLIGIVSWGMMPCGQADAPSVYANVANYVDFITYHMNDN